MLDSVAGSHTIRSIEEIAAKGYPDRRVHPDWEIRFPWVAQGTTTRGHASHEADFSLPSGSPGGVPGWAAGMPAPWQGLAEVTGFRHLVQARQVHGVGIQVHGSSGGGGLVLVGDADGHVSAQPGLLMGITVADCVPVFLLAPRQRALGLLHAGWRGVSRGILEEGLKAMRGAFGSDPRDIFLHLGPAICGSCYEVGPEVHAALGLPAPRAPAPVDLRGVLAARASKLGVPVDGITRSSLCTRCGNSPFFSHRNGHAERQVAYLGVRLS